MGTEQKKDNIKEIVGAVTNRKYESGQELIDGLQRLVDAANKGQSIAEVDPGGQYDPKTEALAKALAHVACMKECREEYFTNVAVPNSIKFGLTVGVLASSGLVMFTGKISSILVGAPVGAVCGFAKLAYHVYFESEQYCASKCAGELIHTTA